MSFLLDEELLTREHRLYQTDWLIRKYGFKESEIPFDEHGNLLLNADPKEVWAARHPELFPIDINRAEKYELLRVPGFGHVTVDNIIKLRRNGNRIRTIRDLGKEGKRLKKAAEFIKFGY